VQKAIEYLETAKKKLSFVDAGIVYTICEKPFNDACEFINSAMVELKALLRWHTLDQWERRTGKPYSDKAPVYVRFRNKFEGHTTKEKSYYWALYTYGDTRAFRKHNLIVCATEAGPPTDDWEPEEAL
jgi:hypothetical protein